MAAYASLVSLTHIMENLKLHPRPPISLHKEQLHLLTQKVSFLQEFLEGYNPHVSYSDEADPLESRIAEAAHAAEDAIEFYIVDRILHQEPVCDWAVKVDNITKEAESTKKQRKKYWRKRNKNVLKGANAPQAPRVDPPQIPSWRPYGTNMYESVEKVIEGMALVEKECVGIKQTLSQLHTKSSTPPDSPTSPSSSSTVQQKKMMMVGADDVLLEMKSMLTSNSSGLQVIPIVGMGGSGKTTLALNIYQDGLIREHFDICVWTTISQEYSIKQIFIEVLGQLNQSVDQHMSEGELGEILYQYLYGRRYIVILDDIWSIEVWDKVKRFLPDNKDGSRIVITTRLSNLASDLSSAKSLEMELLDEANSWNLLSKTVFGGKSCPPELGEIGKKISISCKGLPLSIVVVGGLLAKSKHTREFWEYVEGNLNSVVNLEDDERCLKILHMSYKQLPVHLKLCFMYLGVYPEDKVIFLSRVFKLWVAEGFLKPVSGKSLEEVARMYIKDLADRNLILIDKIGRFGNIKRCRIHDLLRELSLREAEKQRLYTLVGSTPSPQGIACRHIVMPSTTPEDEAADALSSSMSPLARSLTWHLNESLVGDSLERSQLSMSLLRVLDVNMIAPRHGLHRLINSRFLDVSSYHLYPFPSSIWRFWNLQTLIVRMYEVGPTIPSGFWYMPHIRHVQFLKGIPMADPPPDGFVLGDLQTLEEIKDFRCSEQVVKRIPNIKKLGISYSKGNDDGMYSLNNLDRLDKLESFRCTFFNGMNRKGVGSLINFPHSLKRLDLNMKKNVSKYLENILDKIGVLPFLESLTLDEWDFIEGKWETVESQFRSLKFLSVDNCESLKVWITESSHFPCLELLRVYELDKLKKIPLDFAEISTLRVIYVQGCRDSVVVSAKRILQEQEYLYGEETSLRVQVHDFRGNEELRRFASPNFHFKWESHWWWS